MRYRGHFFAIYVFLPLVAAALFGCGKLSVQHPGEGHAGPVGRVEIVVENFVSEARRTIAPDQLTVQQLAGTGYTLKLSGTTGRMSLPERALTLTNGRASLGDIPVGLWELTLTAYDGNSVAVLQGKATHQVRQVGSGEVSFLLTPAGVTGTGTLNLTLNWNQSDFDLMASDTSKDRAWRMALYYPGTEVQLSGSQAEWNRLASSANQSFTTTLTYTGGSVTQIPAGEYEFRFWMWGGGLPAGTTLMWKDNLYVEPGRQTAATVTVPQLAHKPAAPGGLYCESDSNANNYISTLYWKDVYNAESYVIEVKSFTTGTWRSFNENTWNNLGGGNTYTYTDSAWSPNGAPVYKAGSLGKDHTYFGININRTGSGQHWTARIKAVNSYGSSEWTYLKNLMNPQPRITGVTVTRELPPKAAPTNYAHFDLTATTISAVDYATQGYVVELYRLTKQDGTPVEFGAVNSDEGWEDNLTGARVLSKSGLNATNIAYPSLGATAQFCMRIKAVGAAGDSPWAYYEQVLQKAP